LTLKNETGILKSHQSEGETEMTYQFQCKGCKCEVFKVGKAWSVKIQGGTSVYSGYNTRKAAKEAMNNFI
jgi:hypothetical protein